MSARTDTEASTTQATTGVTPDTLGATLKSKLEAQHVDIADLSGAATQPHHRTCALAECFCS